MISYMKRMAIAVLEADLKGTCTLKAHVLLLSWTESWTEILN